MKKILKRIPLIILMLWSVAYGQTIGYLRYDSVKIYKNGGTSELILENATKGVTGGVLVNTWDGRTAFTLTPSLTGFWKTTGNAGLTDANFIGTTDLKNLWFRVNNTKSGGIDVIYANASLGMGAMGSNTTGQQNVAIGTSALSNNITGTGNSAFGMNSLLYNSTGGYNTSAGVSSMETNTTGAYNTAIGTSALNGNTTGQRNTAVGFGAMVANDSGYYNAAFGSYALGITRNGYRNTAVGDSAGYNNTTGYYNTYLGYSSGLGITTGGSNTIIGARITGLTSSLANNIILADGAGNQRLNFNSSGAMQFTGGGFGTANYVLQSNGSGAAPTWVTAATGTVTGTGTANRGAYWDGTSSITSTANWLFDGTTHTLAANGAASTPIFKGTGTWFTGGTATTTKPYLLIEPTGTTSTGWSTSGTGLGVNAASGFTGNLIDAQLNGVLSAKLNTSGTLQLSSGGGGRLIAGSMQIINISDYANTVTMLSLGTANMTFGGTLFQMNGTSSSFPALLRNGTGIDIKLADNSAYTNLTALTLTGNTSVKSPLLIGGTGTTSSLTYKTTTGVGTTGADHIFQVGNNGATEAMRILNSGAVAFNGSTPTSTYKMYLSDAGNTANQAYIAGLTIGTDGNGSKITTATNNITASGAIMSLQYGTGVSIGGYTPSYKLDVTGDIRSTTSAYFATSSGNVGIGTASPSAKLHTISTTEQLRLGYDASNYYSTTVGAAGSTIYNYVGADKIAAFTNGTTDLKFGINTSTPAVALDVVGEVTIGGSGFKVGIRSDNTSGATTIGDWGGENNGNTVSVDDVNSKTFLNSPSIQFSSYGAGAITSDASGNLTSVSDERLKTNIKPYKTGLKELLLIKPIQYQWNEKSKMETVGTYAGFSAQNVRASIPFGTGENKEGYLSLQDRALLATAFNAISELSAKVDKLESQNKQLLKQLGTNPTGKVKKVVIKYQR